MNWIIVIYCVGAFIVSYGVLNVAVYIYQEKMIFWPTRLPADFEFECSEKFEELNISVGNGAVINCVHIKTDNPKGCVLYHHGNSENLSRWIKKHKVFTELGFDVFMYDYRGYGKSTGSITELRLFRDSNKIYNFLKVHYDKNDIVQYGISLGSGIAAKLAVKVNAPRLILETPYLSMLHMAELKMPWIWNRVLLNFHIRTDRFIKKFNGKVGLIHGTLDELVPVEQGEALFELVSNGRMLKTVGGSHNNLDEYPEYNKEMEHLLNEY